MKHLIMILFIGLLSTSVISAQGYDIDYDIKLGFNCNDVQGMIVQTGSATEGQNITFPTYVVPDQFPALKDFQPILNAFAGAEIEIPTGTLNEDVKFEILVNPFPCEFDNINFRELIGLTVKVIGSKSGAYPPFGYFHFNEGMYVTLKLKAENLAVLLSSDQLTLEQLFAWFVSEGLEADLNGIKLSYNSGDEWVVIHLSHFSKISIGIDKSVTELNGVGQMPLHYELQQNYPNPFNPETTIAYSLPQSGFTEITVYNSIGSEVKSLVAEHKVAGNYELTFNARELSSGIYLLSIKSKGFSKTRKMVLLK